MRAMFEQWLITTVISFIIRQITSYTDEINWDLVRVDLKYRVTDLIPGDWLDEAACNLIDSVLDAAREGLKNSKTLDMILNLVAAGKYSQAAEKLKLYLLKAWRPEDETGQHARSLLENVKYV